jgi:hypothetical protein
LDAGALWRRRAARGPGWPESQNRLERIWTPERFGDGAQREGQDGPSLKIAWSEFGRRGLAAAVRSEAEDERPSPAASNLTLSAILNATA